MRHKKLMALSLTAVLAFTACSKKDTPIPTPTAAPTQVPAEPTAEPPTAEPTTEPGQPGNENGGESNPGAAKLTSNETLDKVHTEIKTAYGENYLPNMPYTKENIEEQFDLKPEWYDAAIAEEPMISTNVDKFVGIHATEGNLSSVEDALNKYREALIADTMQYPMNLLKIQACKVVTAGEYVFFIMLGDVDGTAHTEESEIIKAFEEQNQIAIDIIKKNIESK